MNPVYLFDAVRTPRAKGRPGGGLSHVPPADLVARLIEAMCARNGDALKLQADALILGCVGQTGAQGGNVAMAARILGGLREGAAISTVNAFCISGLVAIADAARRIATGEIDLAFAGGVEMMSAVPFLADGAPFYSDLAEAERIGWAPVAIAADAMATREGIGRATLDEAVLRSHARAAAALASGALAGRTVALAGPGGQPVVDELVRPGLTRDQLAALGPAFAEQGAAGFDRIARPEGVEHRHSVAHCPGIADGAALVLVGRREAGEALGLKPVARLSGFRQAGADAVRQLEAGFAAMDLLLAAQRRRLSDLGAVEFMEAFAVVPARFDRDYRPDWDKVNVHGGHLAFGHPMGATGGYLAGMALDAMERLDAADALVVATGGSGTGAALLLERCPA